MATALQLPRLFRIAVSKLIACLFCPRRPDAVVGYGTHHITHGHKQGKLVIQLQSKKVCTLRCHAVLHLAINQYLLVKVVPAFHWQPTCNQAKWPHCHTFLLSAPLLMCPL